MNKKKPEKGATQLARPSAAIVKAQQTDVVWNHANYERELEKAKQIGPEKMTDDALLGFCRGAHGYFQGHYWVDAAPFFKELWRRLKKNDIKGVPTKEEACKQIGCSIRWAQMIVKGTAKDSNERKREAKKKKKEGEVTSLPAVLTDDDENAYVGEILKHSWGKLTPLLSRHWGNYRSICEKLATQFAEAAQTKPSDKARAAGAH